MRERICIVTGANAGLGKATAHGLAKMGATVVLLCRHEARGAAAADEIRAASGNDEVHLLVADLASLQSIRRWVEQFRARFPSLHLLVNNAGTSPMTRRESEDGFELTLAVNHLAPFLLTHLLRGQLEASAPARIVNLAGVYHKRGSIDFEDLQFERRPFEWRGASNQSQLARVLFTRELARKLAGKGVTANCVHPGAVLTSAQKSAPWWAQMLIHTVLRPGFVRPQKGARPVLHLATAPELEGVSGKFFRMMSEDPSTPDSNDPEVARRLWTVSEELVAVGASDPA